MDRGPKYAFLPRGHTNDQQIHEKMVNSTNHEGKVDKNHNEIITSHLSKWLLSTNQQTVSTGEDVEKREPTCPVGGIINWCSHSGKQYGGSSKN